MKKPTIVVAMSGGVDSSVAAGILVKQGYQVIGMMLRLWSEPGFEDKNRCCTPDSIALARRVAARFSIPFYVIDAKEVFREVVVEYFLSGLASGITPNPCLVCNREVRWNFLFKRAMAAGAEYLATGHYSRINQNNKGEYQLLRAIDQEKDQSYVLHVLNQEGLARTLFPLGEYTKHQVREFALNWKIPTAHRPDSQDLCFLAGGDQRSFLVRQDAAFKKPGLIKHEDGRILGEHQGLAFYTIGQRKGIGVSSPKPLYVMEKNLIKNELIVGTADKLGKDMLIASNVHWISNQPPQFPFEADIKIRYKANEVKGLIYPLTNDQVQVKFDHMLRDITPGQAVVFYNQDVCLGGGIIHS
jgi:tRNA-specific 2-thiouridylase